MQPHTIASIAATASAAPIDRVGSDNHIDPETNGDREQQHGKNDDGYLRLDSPPDTPTSEGI